MPRVLIAEDETPLREHLARELVRAWPAAEIVASVSSGVEALRAFEEETPEAAFLDVRMPGLSGIDVANALAGRCHIVFVTAHDDTAVAAFEAGAVDYLLKPISQTRLQLAVSRLESRLRSAPEWKSGVLEDLSRAQPREPLRWLQASAGRNIEFTDVAAVAFFRAEDKYTTVALAGRELVIRTSLKDLLPQLDPQRFWQIHRGAIVNVAFIERAIHQDGELLLVIKGREERLAVSRAWRHRFKQL